MEEQASDVPLQRRKELTVGIIYNLKKKETHTDVPDEEAEYDSIDTVKAIGDALTHYGSEVVFLEDDGELIDKLRKTHIDIAFNIAEGRGGRGREAQIPALLDYLGIPYTGSDATALAVALDKAMTKRLAETYGVRTPKSVLAKIDGSCDALLSQLKFPLIIKPNAEGSGKGISEISIVKNTSELEELLNRNRKLYGSDMLVEEYIDGKEYTVGLLGNNSNARVFSPMELSFRTHTQDDFDVYSYDVKKNYTEYIDYICPAPLSHDCEKEMTEAALTIFNALSCHDFGRVDFRTDKEGNIYFIEINPLPGLAPNYSDYPMLADFCGTDYDSLVNAVLDEAIKRLGM